MNIHSIENCKCGSKPLMPSKVKGLTNGFLIRCAKTSCTEGRENKLHWQMEWNGFGLRVSS